MPNTALRIILALVVSTLYACGGGGSSSSNATPAPPAETPLRISGSITFDRVHHRESGTGLDYNHVTVEPARGISVELVNSAGVVQSASATDNSGNYQLQAPSNANVRLQVKAEMIGSGNATWNVRTTDNTANNALYVIQGALANSGAADSTRNLHAASGWNASTSRYTEPRAAAPLAILDVIYEAIQSLLTVEPSVRLPPLELRWSTANTTAEGEESQGDIGTSFYRASESAIYLVGSANNDTDEYDRHIIAHEWAHYIEDKLSRSDSIGGSHSTGDRLDMRVAFSEGLGYALAAIVLVDPIVRDSFGFSQGNGFSFDVESNQTFNPGWYSESSVQSIVYDIADTNVDGVDQIEIGLAPIYDVLTSSGFRNARALTTIYLFTAQMIQQYPQHAENINALTDSQAVFGRGVWGLGETNNAGQAQVLPVYKQINLASPQTVCTIDQFNSVLDDSSNKLGNSVFLRTPNLSTGDYFINVARISGPTSVEPMISVYRNGRYSFDIPSNVSGGIAWPGSLNSGDYVLELSEADTIPACYRFTLSNN